MENSCSSNNINNKAHQACAACKHQRKGCGPRCILAPYFPANKPEKFIAVMKNIGVRNMQKRLSSLETDEQKSMAAGTLAWEAECRLRDPVNGCWGEYKKLKDEVRRLESKLNQMADCPICNGTIPRQCLYEMIANAENNIATAAMVAGDPNNMRDSNGNENLIFGAQDTAASLQGFDIGPQSRDPLSIFEHVNTMDHGVHHHHPYFLQNTQDQFGNAIVKTWEGGS